MDRPWADTKPGQLVARGHAAGDVLEAWNWRILEQSPGHLSLACDLPDSLKNPMGQLFGGFTPTYIDFVSIFTFQTLELDTDGSELPPWMTTINMRCDYFEPIMGPTFTIRGDVVNHRGKTGLISTKFFLGDAGQTNPTMAAHALTTLRRTEIAGTNMAQPPT